jgi:hypothetical protein
MATLADLVSRLRLELGDPAQPFQAQVVSDGITDRYNLPVELIEATDLNVVAGVTELVEGTDYTMDYRGGVLTLINVPVADTVITVQGSFYETFLPADLETFVNTAFVQHTSGRKDSIGLDLTMAKLPGIEDYLVVLLARIEALWAMVTDAAQEIDVRSPDGVTIPVGQRYQQLLGLIATLKAEYKEMAAALNVGLFRVEMFTLRRVSRTTNRLVPIYQTMEYDQISRGFTPHEGPVGTVVTIKGDRFTGATAVTFNGTAATTFTVISDELIQATVPAGATTGRITITTPGGVVESHYAFTVGFGVPQIAMGASAQRLYPPIDDGQL